MRSFLPYQVAQGRAHTGKHQALDAHKVSGQTVLGWALRHRSVEAEFHHLTLEHGHSRALQDCPGLPASTGNTNPAHQVPSPRTSVTEPSCPIRVQRAQEHAAVSFWSLSSVPSTPCAWSQ